MKDKRQEIVEAIQSGEFSRNELDPTTRGKYAGRLVIGKSVGNEKVDEIYANLTRLRAKGNQITEQITEREQQQEQAVTEITEPVTEPKQRSLAQSVQELQNQLQKAQDDISLLQVEVAGLREQKITEPATEGLQSAVTERHGENVLGFTLAFAGGYWYASKRKDGKNQTVYIGRERSKAEERISAWLVKHERVISP